MSEAPDEAPAAADDSVLAYIDITTHVLAHALALMPSTIRVVGSMNSPPEFAPNVVRLMIDVSLTGNETPGPWEAIIKTDGASLTATFRPVGSK